MNRKLVVKMFLLITIFYRSFFSYATPVVDNENRLDCLATQGLTEGIIQRMTSRIESAEVSPDKSMQSKLFIKDLRDEDIVGKSVLIRVDYNVPLDSSGKITDDTRIKGSLETIKYVRKKGGKVILMSHLGRPKGKIKEEFGLGVVRSKLEELLRQEKGFENISVKLAGVESDAKIGDCVGPKVKKDIKEQQDNEILLLENLRFYEEETMGDSDFSKALADFADVFVCDAFGTVHRKHASMFGVPEALKQEGKLCVMGFLVKKEITYLIQKLSNPEKPYVAILGGKKVSEKIVVIKKLIETVDTLIIGGGMSYAFLEARGFSIGNSFREGDAAVVLAQEIMKIAKDSGVTILLPCDYVVADEYSNTANTLIVNIPEYKKEDIQEGVLNVLKQGIPEGLEALDAGPKTRGIFVEAIKNAKTVIWNGPIGVFEMSKFAEGTKALALAIAEQKDIISVVAGGDTVAAVEEFGVKDKISHISTGGGAALKLLEGKILPGITVLTDDVDYLRQQTEKAA
jgi:phosphoglycerate kinase